MSSIQVADQTFVAAPGLQVAAVVSSPSNWRRWWPDLSLEVREDRADKGIRWSVAGDLVGTMEVWLEPALDGVILHYFLHAEPSDGRRDVGAIIASNRGRRVAGKKMSFEVKEKLEAGRPAGQAPTR